MSVQAVQTVQGAPGGQAVNGVNEPFGTSTRQHILERLQAGETPAQIREQITLARKEEFQRSVQEALGSSQEYTQALSRLDPFRQEAGDSDFLAAGKKQIQALKEQIQLLRDSKKSSQEILDDLNKHYDQSAVHNAALSTELHGLQNQLKNAPPIIPFHRVVTEAGNRLQRRKEF